MQISTKLAMVLSLLAAGCAEQGKKSIEYWTPEKSGAVNVHHVAGGLDRVEKLSQKAISKDEVKDLGLVTSHKYFEVAEEKPIAFVVAKKKDTPKKEKPAETIAALSAKVEKQAKAEAEMRSELRELRSQRKQQSESQAAPKSTAEVAPTPAPAVSAVAEDQVRVAR